MIAIGINDVSVCFLSAQRLSLSLFCVIPFANTSLISGNSSSVCCYFRYKLRPLCRHYPTQGAFCLLSVFTGAGVKPRGSICVYRRLLRLVQVDELHQVRIAFLSSHPMGGHAAHGNPFGFEMLGRNEFALRRDFACGKMLVRAYARPAVRGPTKRPSIYETTYSALYKSMSFIRCA